MVLTWALVIATKDRIAPLAHSVRFALTQSRPPIEVIIVDASTDWAAHKVEITGILAEYPAIRLTYLQAARPSSAVQRNQGIAKATADVLFLIDDDSFLFPDAAEQVMQIYEADPEGAVAGVQLAPSARSPGDGPDARQQGNLGLENVAPTIGLKRSLLRAVLSYGPQGNFIPYDDTYPDRPIPETLARFAVKPSRLFEGFRMTLRRTVAARLEFEPLLLYYSPGEDLDLSYRASREGAMVMAREAKVHHFNSGDGRLKRHQVAMLGTLNQALFLRRNGANPKQARARYLVRVLHRVLAGAMMDLAQRRLNFPKARGTWAGLWLSGQIFRASLEELEQLYPALQERIVKGADKT